MRHCERWHQAVPSIGVARWHGMRYSQEDGRWILKPIDISAVTDEERAQWDMPTLEETSRMLEQWDQTAAEKAGKTTVSSNEK